MIWEIVWRLLAGLGLFLFFIGSSAYLIVRALEDIEKENEK